MAIHSSTSDDAEILKERVAKLNARLLDKSASETSSGPPTAPCGGFRDLGLRGRSSDISAQTAVGGSFPPDRVRRRSFSGSLFSGVPGETLMLTNEKRNGDVWFFHHGFAGADCGVHAVVEFRVYTCSKNAPSR